MKDIKTTCKLKKYISLYTIFFLYSISTVLSKYAAIQSSSSICFFVLYGLAILSLGCYAVCWQQILKIFKLNVAYANKAVVIVLGMIWGALLFGEVITINKVVGCLVIAVGIYMVVSENG